MRPRADELEKIDKFLSGKLKGADLDLFQAKMERDPAYAMLVDAQKKANELVIGNRLSKVKEMMKHDFASGKAKAGSGKTGWIAGGSVVVIMGAALLFFSKDEQIQKPVKDKLTVSLTETVDKKEVKADKSKEEDILIEVKTPEQKQEMVKPENIRPEEKETNEFSSDTFFVAILPEKNQKRAEQEPAQSSLSPDPVVSETVRCSETAPNAKVEMNKTCEGKNEGNLFVSLTGTDRKKNFAYLLSSSGSKDTLKSRSGNFNLLSAGNYSLFFKDDKGCITSYKEALTVESKTCIESRSFSFSPTYNEVLTIPVPEGKEGVIRIYSKSGREVYSAFFRSENPAWKGYDQSNVAVSSGMFIYILEFTDGNKEKGDIAVY